MKKYFILLGIIVNCIWGLAFFVPYYLSDIEPTLIVFSRYFFYGLISFILLLVHGHLNSLNKLDWKKAMLFAFAGNLGYYFFVTVSIHYAGIAIPTLIIGALPITMLIYANITNKEFSYHKLILPSVLILGGIIGLRWIQYGDITTNLNLSQVLFGSASALIALIIWTWFGVANANYLKNNFGISGYTWNLAIGACTLAQVLILFPITLLFHKEAILTDLTDPNLLYKTVVGGIILGIIVSWIATGLWNKVSRELPTTLASQLLVFETISSLSYSYIHDRTFPQPEIILCLVIVITGIILGIRASKYNTSF